MILSTSIRLWFRHRIQWVKANPLLTILCSLLVVMLAAFVAVMFSGNVCWISPYLGLTEKNQILTFLGIGMGGILLAVQAVIANKRAKAMEDTAKAQAKATEEQAKANQNTERGQRQERFKNAIEHLGHQSVSVRLGGAYELFHLAKDTTDDARDLRQTVLDILCAHIRRTTGEAEYREKHQSKPSEEIQSLLTLLFMQKHKVFKSCHINLQGSWLNGARLRRARLQGANLAEARLQDTNLIEASLQGANLILTHLQKADLSRANLMESFLGGATLQRACVVQGQLQKAWLFQADLQAADLRRARLQGVNLNEARMQAAEFRFTELQEASLKGTYLQGVKLRNNDDWKSTSFSVCVRESVGKESDLSGAIFAGGLTDSDLDSIVKDLPRPQARKLREKLQPHIDSPQKNELPKDSGAITGAYTKEEAEQWIADYEEAMSEVPKVDNGR